MQSEVGDRKKKHTMTRQTCNAAATIKIRLIENLKRFQPNTNRDKIEATVSLGYTVEINRPTGSTYIPSQRDQI